jgi:hypothetical protein
MRLFPNKIILLGEEMKKSLVLALGFFVVFAGVFVTGTTKDRPVEFTLANPELANVIFSSPAASFRLAPRSAGPMSNSGLGSPDPIEYFNNTALGNYALANYDQNGVLGNTAIGYYALNANLGGNNTGIGDSALKELNFRLSSDNTAIGYGALRNITGVGTGINGSYGNTAIGSAAGQNLVNGIFNIYLGFDANPPESAKIEAFTIRIGSYQPPNDQRFKCFIQGINNTPYNPNTMGVYPPKIVGVLEDGMMVTYPDALLPKGDRGPMGPQGPTGPGLMSGSLLLLPSTMAAPTGYTFIGSTELKIDTPDKKKDVKIIINVYQKL